MNWLADRADVDPEIALAAVAWHHLKSAESRENGYPALGDALAGMAEHLVVLTGSPEFHASVEHLATRLGWLVPAFDFPRMWRLYDGDNPVLEQAERLRHRLHRFNKQLPSDPDRRALLMAVKAAVLVADTAGSGLKREAREIPDWIGCCFEEPPSNSNLARRSIELLKNRALMIVLRSGFASKVASSTTIRSQREIELIRRHPRRIRRWAWFA